MSLFLRLRFTDRTDHSIDTIESNLQSLKDMCTCFRYSEIIASPTDDYLISMCDKFDEHFFEIEKSRLESTTRESNHIE